jgi:ribosomal 30S subunit maturation factor RimM
LRIFKLSLTEMGQIIDTVGVNGWPRKVDEVADEPEVATKVDDVRKLLVHVQEDSELDAVTVHTAGEKGYDGFMYCIRK